MAVFANTRTQYQAGSAASRIANAFASTVNAIVAWNEVRATRTALSRLTDRELEDIGLSRGDIEWISRR